MSDDDLDLLLADLNNDVPPMTDEAFESGRARLRGVVDSGTLVTTPALDDDPVVRPLTNVAPLRSPPRKKLRLIASVAAVVVAVAGGLVASMAPFSDQPGAVAVADSLRSAAEKVETVPDEPVGPGQYRYTRVHTESLSETAPVDGRASSILTYIQQGEQEIWMPADQTDEWLWRDRPGEIRWVDGSDERAAELGAQLPPHQEGTEVKARCGDFFGHKSVDGPELAECEWPADPRNPSPAWLAALPSDPRTLYGELVEEAGDPAPGYLLETVMAMLDTGAVPAEVRANLYEAIAFIPGLTITDDAADLDGRVGVAYGVRDGRWSQELIIDPATGAYLGSRRVLAEAMGGNDGTMGDNDETTMTVRVDESTSASNGAPGDGSDDAEAPSTPDTVVRMATRHHPAGTVFSFSAVYTDVVDEIGVAPAR